MAEVLDVVRSQRASLLRRETRTTRAMFDEWAALARLVAQERASLAERMRREVEHGGVIRASWLHAYGRLDELGVQIAGEVDGFTRRVVPVIGEFLHDAEVHGYRSATTVASTAGIPQGDLIRADLNARAVERVAALTAREAPVGRVLLDAGREAASMLRDELLRGATLGENPLTIARRMTRVADVPLARARTIARTEAMRAYRGSQVETWSTIEAVEGWVWVSAADANTCAACLAMHGTEHPTTDELESHPNCRCVPAPLVPGVRVVERTGAQIIRSMDEAELTRRVGPTRARLLRGGQLTPADLVGVRESPVWGRTRGLASVESALANAAARRAATL